MLIVTLFLLDRSTYCYTIADDLLDRVVLLDVVNIHSHVNYIKLVHIMFAYKIIKDKYIGASIYIYNRFECYFFKHILILVAFISGVTNHATSHSKSHRNRVSIAVNEYLNACGACGYTSPTKPGSL